MSVQAPVLHPSVKAGGTLRIVAKSDVSSMDPALAYDFYSWPLESATCAKLLNYPDKPLPAGNQLVPEVAAALPSRSADGKTYTFTIRQGFRFSPPSNAPVTAQTFKDTIERTLNPKMKSPAAQPDFLTDVVGEQAYETGKAKHISGISVHGNKLTIRLTDDSGRLLAALATAFFCAVPSDTPIDPKGVRTVASAGPYYVSSYTPGQGVVLKRNPNYSGDRPHHLNEIDFTPNVPQKQAVAEIKAGQIDYSLDGAPPDQDRQLQARYGAEQPGRQSRPAAVLHLPRLVARLPRTEHQPAAFRRPEAAPGSQLRDRPPGTPPHLRASRPSRPTNTSNRRCPVTKTLHIYPSVPDVARARQLAHGRHGTAVLYTGNASNSREKRPPSSKPT